MDEQRPFLKRSRRARRTGAPGGASSMLARATAQAGEGAEMLFARLEGADTPQGRGAATLARWAERIRAGEWTPEIAELVAHAEALERDLPH